jgi:hypothetical protein
MCDLEGVAAEELVRLVVELYLDGRRDVGDPPFVVDPEDDVARVVCKEAVARFALGKFVLRCYASLFFLDEPLRRFFQRLREDSELSTSRTSGEERLASR